ncbi:MAG TPA: GAF domain-containing protein, partial [Terricaulis sp.]|nr:GAF domain-containing protein [Terricaulis sp.]
MRVAWPADEDARLAAVAALDWPESDTDPGLDEIADLAATFLGMPTAIISLTGERHQIAIAGRGAGRMSAPREVTMCKHVLSEGALFVVNDAAADARVTDCPYVTQAPYVRFYAGAPLWSEEGYCLGTFCVVDFKPHPDFSDAQRNALSSFARMAEQRLRAHTLRKRMETAEAARAVAKARTRNIL